MAAAAVCSAVKIGIIGGTGLDDPEILEGRTEKYIDTPFGKPSDALISGKIKNVDCVLLSRHGRHHSIMPTNINFRANMWALKEEGCTHLLVTTACGSLREEIQPGDLVIIDQFIDRTTKRHLTFYDGSNSCLPGVCHVSMAEPFCAKTREVLLDVAKKLGIKCHSKGTVITVEGPRFSSRAESLMFRSWGADVINMTTVPEVILAKEAGICYASIAMATDYDCWKEHEETVSVDRVLKTLKENANKATSLLLTAIPQIGSMEWSETHQNLKAVLMQSRELVSEELVRLQKDNESLQGKHCLHVSLQQAEDFILPETGEGLRELVLKYREDIISVRTAADHLEEKLKAEILFLKEQIQAEQCLKENIEETLQLEIENCKEEIAAASSLKTELEQIRVNKEQLESNLKEKIQQLENFGERENDLEEQLKKEIATKANLEHMMFEEKNKAQRLQTELDVSEQVQRDFVKLSQTLQVQLERIRQADSLERIRAILNDTKLTDINQLPET